MPVEIIAFVGVAVESILGHEGSTVLGTPHDESRECNATETKVVIPSSNDVRADVEHAVAFTKKLDNGNPYKGIATAEGVLEVEEYE